VTSRPARFADAVRSEWTKFRTVRSTYWTFAIAAALGIGLGILSSWVSADHYSTDLDVRLGWNPTQRSIVSLELAQLAFAVLGVIDVTSEYSTGMIRTTLTAVPRRARMAGAKLLVFAGCAVVVGEAISFGAFGVGQALIHGRAPSASLGDHLVLRVVVGAGLYLVVVGLLGSAFGLMMRHTAGGIAVIVAMLFIVPGLALAALPTSWSDPFLEYWPTNAGQRILFFDRGAHKLGAWIGFGELVAFAALVVAVALWLLEWRDA
jgi:hypothetical protein